MEGNYLSQCHQEYVDLFIPELLNKDVTNIDINEQKEIIFKLDDFELRCFILLSKSILSGEYLYNADFVIELKEFITHTAVEVSQHTKTPIMKKYYSISDNIYNALNQYSGFYSYVSDSYNINLPEFKLNIYKRKSIETDKSIIFKFTEFVLPICQYDYKYPLKKSLLEKFSLQYFNIKELKNNEANDDIKFIYDILFYKCNYIFKRIGRKINFSELGETNKIEPNGMDLGFLETFFNKQITFVLPSEREIECLRADIFNSNNTKFESFIRLSWFIAKNKDGKYKSDMKNLITKFEYIYTSNYQNIDPDLPFLFNYDNFALNSIYNFLLNCDFSLSISVDPFTISSIKKRIDRIFDVQSGTSINNFHPYKKGIEAIFGFATDYLEQIGDNQQPLNEDELFERLDTYIEKYEEHIKWGRNHRFFPFQLTFRESIVAYKDFPIFMPSTFANTIDYDDLEKKLIEYKNNRQILANKFESYKSRQAISDLSKKIKEDRFNMTQTMILFAGIITFLFGTINIFMNNKDINLTQLIINTSGLGIILLLFTTTTLFVAPAFNDWINFKEIKKSNRFWLSLVAIAIYLIAIISIYYNIEYLQKNENMKIINSIIDKSPLDKIELLENDSLYIFKIIKGTE